MGAKRWIFRRAKRLSHLFGADLILARHSLTLEAALDRIRSRGIAINTVIDVGASDGRWSERARPYLGANHYHLIEANGVHEPALNALVGRRKDTSYVMAAAGDRVGTIYFDNSDPFGGLASLTPLPYASIEVPVTTIDEEIARLKLSSAYAIKLDTHGFEAPILAGAARALRATELLVIEVYNFRLRETSLRFYEMCAHMEALGFLPVDLCDVLHRPYDDAWWQMDLLFVPSDHPVFQTDSYFGST